MATLRGFEVSGECKGADTYENQKIYVVFNLRDTLPRVPG